VAIDRNAAHPWRLALVQENATVGDLAGNADLVLARTREAASAGACLVAFPEMFLTGYPVEDLALRKSFIEASQHTLQRLARRLDDEGLGHVGVIVGYLDSSADHIDRLGRPRHSPQNAAALLRAGSVEARYAKHHLPNYGVFDEFRYFVPGSRGCTVEVAGRQVAVAICEDLWQEGGPVTWARQSDADLLLVINGSPYERDKDDTRLELCSRRAVEAGMPVAYVNLVGGQDELVFDGDSLVVDKNGEVMARAAQFTPALLCVDVFDAPAAPHPPAAPTALRMGGTEEVYQALVCGVTDYVRKNGFSSVLIGMSGGIDSALTAAIAVDALGPTSVYGVAMPSVYSSQHSLDDAADMAKRTGMDLRVVPIAPMVDAFLGQLTLDGLAAENLQARIRGTTLMAISNQEGHLVLATGNKSELAVGYSTLYGDAVGAYAPLKDVSKTVVWQLARWRNDQASAQGLAPPIPPSSITKPPSAELRPGQLDTDSLPDYDVLDDVLDDYVEQDAGAADLVDAGFPAELVERILTLTDRAEYKRRQYPPGPKISFKAFGRDRRLPITSRWREHIADSATP
jgi:NAD+ synthase (glutamine-hydrolysing)